MGALALFVLATPAGSAPASSPAESRAAALQALSACRSRSDPMDRLACFDAAAARLDEAEKKGDIVVVDRRQAQEVRRQAFGFTLPSMALFARAEGEEKLDRVESVLAEARRGPDGKWVVRLENGAVWRQTDAEGPARTPRPGMKVVVRSASLGSFLVSVDGQAGFRAKREE
ncbi:MAG: hypothetical protein ACKN9P_11065 [Phenylobacterium sp.]